MSYRNYTKKTILIFKNEVKSMHLLLLLTTSPAYYAETNLHKPFLKESVTQTAGISLQTDLGDEDAGIQNSFDVLQPAWALQALQEVGHGGRMKLAHWKHNTAVSVAGNAKQTWSLEFMEHHSLPQRAICA